MKTKIVAGLLSVLLLVGIANADKVPNYAAQATGLGTEVFYCVTGSTDCSMTLQVISGFISGNTVRTLNWYATTDLCATTTGPIDVISSTTTKLIIDRAATCTLDKTVPSTLAIDIVPGGKITMTNSKLLQITGPFDAPMNQKVFFNATAGQGTVGFKGQGNVAVLYPMWWGAIGDYSTASGPAIQAALTAASDLYRPSFGGGYAAHVELGSGGYLIATPGLRIGCFVLFKGQSVGGTTLQTSGSGNDYDMITSDGASDCSGNSSTLNVSIRDMKLIKTGGTTASSYIKFKSFFQMDIRDVSFANTTGHGITADTGNTLILDHLEIAGHSSNVGKAVNVKDANVTELNVSHELFDVGIYCLQTGTVPCQVASFSPYFEANLTTDVVLDASLGSAIYSPIHKTGQTTPTIGYSFVNGAHHNNVYGGSVDYIGNNGFSPPFKTDATSFHNCVYGSNWQTNLGTAADLTICWDGVSQNVANYQVSMTPDLWKYNYYRKTFDSGSAWTMNAPLNPGPMTKLKIMFRNASGGAMGAATFNGVFKMPTFTAPANGFSRTYEWEWDGTNWVETFRSAADVPN